MRTYFCMAFLGVWLSASLQTQSTEADVRARLMDKPLYLRGMWTSDKLHFDASGQLQGHSSQSSFTLSGVDVTDIHVEKNRLSIDGRRMGLTFDPSQTRIPLKIGKPGDLHDEVMHIEIDTPQNGDYGPVLDAIFADSLAALTPSLPDIWQKYARTTFLQAGASESTPLPDPEPQSARRIGGGVLPPKVLKTGELAYPNAARLLKSKGVVTVTLYVEADGSPSHLSILRPIGLGMDEQAVAAIEQYKFAPATEGGHPVRVQLNIQVNFQIF